jgi:Protein of unknown function (DUF3891)
VFRSRRRPVVFPQLEHARLAAAIALAWDDGVAPVPLPRESFVAGVALHDRGYGEHDADEIWAVPKDRWLEIQRRGFTPVGDDAVVDLVVGMHVRRLVSHRSDESARRALAEMDAALVALRDDAGLREEDAAAADRITDLCDRVAFDFCHEQPASGVVSVAAGDGRSTPLEYEIDGQGNVVLDPWPLRPRTVAGFVLGYAAEGYPGRLEPVVTRFTLAPR